ncbi:MAG: ATP-binding cassette domain-containing protein, partial [Candidatus Borkfalkiaceae bacterium]|nr:ATP-binding cassette domain-containing protein [Clostridia bacterium]MDY6222627.1 ATP-binding cassette domain-containing protein [Christensenellaceae bacterium]
MSGEHSGKTPYIPADGDGGNNDKNNGGNNGGNNVLLSLRGIEKTYGDKRVLSDLSLDIYRGETLCILGESGGGKTTLLNILARLTSCDKGEVSFAPPERLQRGDNAADCILTERRGKKDRQDYPRVAYAFQDGRLLPNLTALENLTFAGGEKENCRALLKAAFLSDKEKK